MPKSDNLGDRIKQYENVTRNKLVKRMPVMIRLDGKAFHTFTKNPVIKDDTPPFSEKMHFMMCKTMEALCNEIQNVVFAYTQSDEITLLLRDWDKLTTGQWFDGNIQKMASVSASIATAAFNLYWLPYFKNDWRIPKLAKFDSRVWNIPKEEVVNAFLWRQQDATRNSVQMLGRHYFSHKELHRKNASQIQDMLMNSFEINWNDIDTWKKRGTAMYREDGAWILDEEMPIITQDRDYIGRHLIEGEQ